MTTSPDKTAPTKSHFLSASFAWQANTLLYAVFVSIYLAQIPAYLSLGVWKEPAWLTAPLAGLVFDLAVLLLLLKRKSWVRFLIALEMSFSILWLALVGFTDYAAIVSAYLPFYMTLFSWSRIPAWPLLLPMVLSVLNLILLVPRLETLDLVPRPSHSKRIIRFVSISAFGVFGLAICLGMVPVPFSDCLKVTEKVVTSFVGHRYLIYFGSENECSFSVGEPDYARLTQGEGYVVTGRRSRIDCHIDRIGDSCER